MFASKILPNMVASSTIIKYGFEGPTQILSFACSNGNNAIINGINIIQNDLVDIAIVGASEGSLHPLTLAGFHRLKSLSTKGISRPFGRKRDGFIVSEGYNKIILENYEHTMRKTGDLWATVENIDITNAVFHMTTSKQDT